MNIYQELKAAGIEISNHESDLYAKKDANSQAIVKKYQYKKNVRVFINQIDGTLWYDIPFAFAPFWAEMQAKPI